MAPAHVLEPTYDAIRRRLLAVTWAPGSRLEAIKLADELGVSITPVRDSLNRLTGERLVHSSAGDGFSVPPIDEGEFRTLIEWHHNLMTLTLARRSSLPSGLVVPHGFNGTSERSALLFATIAGISASAEIIWAVSNVNARLSRYRWSERRALGDVEGELDAIEAAISAAKPAALATRLRSYHRRRLRAAPAIVREIRATER